MLLWFILLAIFLVTFVVWHVAAYAMYRELEKEKADAEERLAARVRPADMAHLLEVAKQRIEEVIEQGKRSERELQGASGEDMPRLQAEHARKFKAELLRTIEDAANKPLREHGRHPLDTNEINSTNDVRKMYRLGEKLIRELEVARSTLRSNPR